MRAAPQGARRPFPSFKTVDTCAAEIAEQDGLPLHALTTTARARPIPPTAGSVMILGGRPEPHRPGHRVRLLLRPRLEGPACRSAGRRSWSTAIRKRCRPTLIRPTSLYFEPRDARRRARHRAKSRSPTGVIVQYGGQTPLKLARALQEAGVPIMGTYPEAIDLAEDRDRFSQVSATCFRRLIYPAAGEASTRSKRRIGLLSTSAIPLLVRPSYVLGGRGMAIVLRQRPA